MATVLGQQKRLFDEPPLSKHNEQEQHGPTPAELWDGDVIRHALDGLVNLALQYKSSKSYQELIRFVGHFRFYSPYNAMLVHIQMPGAKFVAPAHRWIREYGRRIKPNAHPLVILQPRGPVMFVFDVTDTEAGTDAPPLPQEVEKPFEVRCGHVGYELEGTIENSKRDGVRILLQKEGSQSAGCICKKDHKSLPSPLFFRTGTDKDGKPIYAAIPYRYNLVLNRTLSREAIYATMVHELAHLYCGHLGTLNKKWWPDRQGLAKNVGEFEAESVTYLLCGRLGIDNPSEQYLAGYMERNPEVPAVSLECIMKVAGLIEKMGQERLKLREGQD
ncbi:MAG: hypothetical protein ABSH06_29485 [Thermodesulfobacteriota bacterium]|jgi:hypothetical protein